MFEVVKGRNDRYVEYELKDKSSNTSAKVVPENGGMLISLIKDDYEYIWLDEDNFYYGEKPSCANPILFPNNGALENDSYIVDGKKYKMLQHGLARRNDWVFENSSTDNGASIRISLSSNEETIKFYPYEFKLTFTYTLKGNELQINQVYENLGDGSMPFNFGFHPYFNVSSVDKALVIVDGENIRKWSPSGWDPDFSKARTKEYYLDMSQGESQIQLTGLKSPMKLFDQGRKKEIIVEFDENFSTAVVWSNNIDEFICVEPWSNRQNGLNEDRFFILEKDQRKERTVKYIVD